MAAGGDQPLATTTIFGLTSSLIPNSEARGRGRIASATAERQFGSGRRARVDPDRAGLDPRRQRPWPFRVGVKIAPGRRARSLAIATTSSSSRDDRTARRAGGLLGNRRDCRADVGEDRRLEEGAGSPDRRAAMRQRGALPSPPARPARRCRRVRPPSSRRSQADALIHRVADLGREDVGELFGKLPATCDG